ncbi:MAG: glycosyl hydrolase, partial [Candidatus Bathyarchaeota archaeon]|nr:glycosyl hydrolase [Candidatus Bathyarchaeota archaeon]
NMAHTVNFVTTTQYHLTITGGNSVGYGLSSPTGDQWYDSGTSTSVSSDWVWDKKLGQSRYAITNYAVDGVSQNPARQYTGTLTTSTIFMSSHHTVAFTSTTQYKISFAVNNTLSGTITVPSQSPQWIDAGTSNLSASPNSGYTFFSWSASPAKSITFADSRSATTTMTVNGAATVTATFRKIIPGQQVLHFAMVQNYGDTNATNHINQFNTLVGKPIYGYDNWAGQYPNGWGDDLNYLLGSGPQGLLPLFQDGTLHALSLVWIPATSTTDQQTLRDIIAGTEDTYIITAANQCKTFGYPIYMRLGGEMNLHQEAGGWGLNPDDFVGAWKHIVDVFRARGVSNVIWVWNPNCSEIKGSPYHWTDYYPGDGYVDWVGIDMFQYNDIVGDVNAAPEKLIEGIYNDYSARKPIAICEYGTNSYFLTGVDTPDAMRAAWLTAFFDAVELRPQVKMISYYYHNHFAFNSSSAPLTLAVYQSRIANSIYISAVD